MDIADLSRVIENIDDQFQEIDKIIKATEQDLLYTSTHEINEMLLKTIDDITEEELPNLSASLDPVYNVMDDFKTLQKSTRLSKGFASENMLLAIEELQCCKREDSNLVAYVSQAPPVDFSLDNNMNRLDKRYTLKRTNREYVPEEASTIQGPAFSKCSKTVPCTTNARGAQYTTNKSQLEKKIRSQHNKSARTKRQMVSPLKEQHQLSDSNLQHRKLKKRKVNLNHEIQNEVDLWRKAPIMNNQLARAHFRKPLRIVKDYPNITVVLDITKPNTPSKYPIQKPKYKSPQDCFTKLGRVSRNIYLTVFDRKKENMRTSSYVDDLIELNDASLTQELYQEYFKIVNSERNFFISPRRIIKVVASSSSSTTSEDELYQNQGLNESKVKTDLREKLHNFPNTTPKDGKTSPSLVKRLQNPVDCLVSSIKENKVDSKFQPLHIKGPIGKLNENPSDYHKENHLINPSEDTKNIDLVVGNNITKNLKEFLNVESASVFSVRPNQDTLLFSPLGTSDSIHINNQTGLFDVQLHLAHSNCTTEMANAVSTPNNSINYDDFGNLSRVTVEPDIIPCNTVENDVEVNTFSCGVINPIVVLNNTEEKDTTEVHVPDHVSFTQTDTWNIGNHSKSIKRSLGKVRYTLPNINSVPCLETNLQEIVKEAEIHHYCETSSDEDCRIVSDDASSIVSINSITTIHSDNLSFHNECSLSSVEHLKEENMAKLACSRHENVQRFSDSNTIEAINFISNTINVVTSDIMQPSCDLQEDVKVVDSITNSIYLPDTIITNDRFSETHLAEDSKEQSVVSSSKNQDSANAIEDTNLLHSFTENLSQEPSEMIPKLPLNNEVDSTTNFNHTDVPSCTSTVTEFAAASEENLQNVVQSSGSVSGISNTSASESVCTNYSAVPTVEVKFASIKNTVTYTIEDLKESAKSQNIQINNENENILDKSTNESTDIKDSVIIPHISHDCHSAVVKILKNPEMASNPNHTAADRTCFENHLCPTTNTSSSKNCKEKFENENANISLNGSIKSSMNNSFDLSGFIVISSCNATASFSLGETDEIVLDTSIPNGNSESILKPGSNVLQSNLSALELDVQNTEADAKENTSTIKPIMDLPHISSDIGMRPGLLSDSSHTSIYVPNLNVSSINEGYVPKINTTDYGKIACDKPAFAKTDCDNNKKEVRSTVKPVQTLAVSKEELKSKVKFAQSTTETASTSSTLMKSTNSCNRFDKENSKINDSNTETFQPPNSIKTGTKRSAPKTTRDRQPSKRYKSSRNVESQPSTSQIHNNYSKDPKEIADNNDPKWKLYNFQEPEDCFLAVRNQWCSAQMPEPHEDLTRRFHTKKPTANFTQYSLPGDRQNKSVECLSIYSAQIDEVNNRIDILKHEMDINGPIWNKRQVNGATEKLRNLYNTHHQLIRAWDEANRFYSYFVDPNTGWNAHYMGEYNKNETLRQFQVLASYEDFYGYHCRAQI